MCEKHLIYCTQIEVRSKHAIPLLYRQPNAEHKGQELFSGAYGLNKHTRVQKTKL